MQTQHDEDEEDEGQQQQDAIAASIPVSCLHCTKHLLFLLMMMVVVLNKRYACIMKSSVVETMIIDVKCIVTVTDGAYSQKLELLLNYSDVYISVTL